MIRERESFLPPSIRHDHRSTRLISYGHTHFYSIGWLLVITDAVVNVTIDWADPLQSFPTFIRIWDFMLNRDPILFAWITETEKEGSAQMAYVANQFLLSGRVSCSPLFSIFSHPSFSGTCRRLCVAIVAVKTTLKRCYWPSRNGTMTN